MACLFYEITLDSCGLCDLRSDHFADEVEPSGQTIANCKDPENENCSHYEEEE